MKNPKSASVAKECLLYSRTTRRYREFVALTKQLNRMKEVFNYNQELFTVSAHESLGLITDNFAA